MRRTRTTVTAGALLIAAAALVAPTPASALATHHAPPVVVPAAHHVTDAHQVTVDRVVTRQAAKRPAASTDQQQIRQAILHSKLLGVVRPSDIAVSGIRLAGAGHVWAGALVTPKNGQTDPAQVLLHKSGTAWQVSDLGTASVGCGIAPDAVRNTLGLHGVC